MLLVAMVISDCVGAPNTAISTNPNLNPNWTRASVDVAGCVSYAPRKREAVDLTIVLNPEFEQQLMGQLAESDHQSPRCWYETPEGSIRLFAGDFCAGGIESTFKEQDGVWKLQGTRLVSIACRPIN